jgi:hypothetical protein
VVTVPWKLRCRIRPTSVTYAGASPPLSIRPVTLPSGAIRAERRRAVTLVPDPGGWPSQATGTSTTSWRSTLPSPLTTKVAEACPGPAA